MKSIKRGWNWESVINDPKKLKIIGEMGKAIHKIGGHIQSRDIKFNI